MAKLYEGAIKLASTIWETGAQPLDDRVVVKTKSDLLNADTFKDVAYPGMVVVVAEENAAYILKAVTGEDGKVTPAITTEAENWIVLAKGETATGLESKLTELTRKFNELDAKVTGETTGLIAKVDKLNGTAETEGSVAHAVAAEATARTEAINTAVANLKSDGNDAKEDATIAGAKLFATDAVTTAKTTIDAYTINSKKISENPTLGGKDIVITDYAKGTKSALAVEDTVNIALGKLEAGVDDNAAAISQEVTDRGTAITTAKGEIVGASGDTSDKDTINGAKKYADEKAAAAKKDIDEYTINTKLIKDSPVLNGADIKLDGYTIADAKTTIVVGDTVNVAIGKLEKGVDILNGDENTAGSLLKAVKDIKGDAAADYDTLGKLEDKIIAEASRADGAEKVNAKAIKDLSEGQVKSNKEAIELLNKTDGTVGSVKKTVDDAIAALSKENGAIKKVADDLAAETTARTEADTKHTQDIATNAADIATLTSQQRATGNAVSALNRKVDVDKVSTAISTAVTTEKERAEAAEKANTEKIADHETRIASNESAIEALSSATHFIGVFTRPEGNKDPLPTDSIITDKYAEGHVPADGDVVLDGNKEYIFSAGDWKELGDTTAEGERIAEIEKIVNKENTGSLQTKVTELENNITSGTTKQAIDKVAGDLTSEIERAKKAETMAKTVVSGSTNITVSPSEEVDGQPITYTITANELVTTGQLSTEQGRIATLEGKFDGNKAKEALVADKVATKLTIKSDATTVATFDGSAAEELDIVGGTYVTVTPTAEPGKLVIDTKDLATDEKVNGIDARLVTAEGSITTLTGEDAGSVKKAEADAKLYADGIKTELLGSATGLTDLGLIEEEVRTNSQVAANGLTTEQAARRAQTGIDGDAYTAPSTTTYLTGATSLNNADVLLDAEIKKINDSIGSSETGVGKRLTDLENKTSDVTTTVGGLIDTKIEALSLGDIITHNHSEYASAAQGTKADTALQSISSANDYVTIPAKASGETAQTVTINVAASISGATANQLPDAVQVKDALATKIEKVTINGVVATGEINNKVATINASNINVGKNLNYSGETAGDITDNKIDVILQDIYTKLKSTNDGKVTSVKGTANEVNVTDGNDPVVSLIKEDSTIDTVKAGHIEITSGANGLYALMYYDGDDTETVAN